MNRWREVRLIVGLTCGVLTLTASASAATLNVVEGPSGFRLPATHGYSISVFAYSEGSGQRGAIDITVRRKDESAFYRAPANVTADTIQAGLGRIGRVELVLHRSGQRKTVHPRCFGSKVTYEPATYEGFVEFNGEEGYARARATRVAGLPIWLLVGANPCGGGYGEAIGVTEPGARLRGISLAHNRILSFQANKNGPKAPTIFKASLKERRDRVRIQREVTGRAPPRAFRFDPQLRTAVLGPAGPLSGSASLARSRSSFWPVWSGDLTLDFPGHADVSIAGRDVHVSLVHSRFTRSSGSQAGIGF